MVLDSFMFCTSFEKKQTSNKIVEKPLLVLYTSRADVGQVHWGHVHPPRLPKKKRFS